uniref:Multifunctional methyltransferase subunit TRM112-like protein n=1 Tax=Arcella intermedia TaxID=1963864 RepID=A0A6B2LRQ7_9EUKA
MKLLTHNILQSNVKGVKNGYPLMLKATKITILDVPVNFEFIKNIMGRIDYQVLRAVAIALGYTELPAEIPGDADTNEDFMRKLHHALQNIEVEEGELQCKESGRVFPINNGIPNMLLHENEV